MCGIVGWVSFKRDLEKERPTIEAMVRTMALRGPDAEGIWIDSHAALGHRRLSIIDLAGGRQPMVAESDGKGPPLAVLTYSGEVYNFVELRAELEAFGHVFRTKSDTEVVLRAYLQWGEDVADHLNGMFAFAVWDPRSKTLLLVRDRMGVKPLFYMTTNDGVLFGSEVKAILANPNAKAHVDKDGLRELLTLVKTPERTIYSGISEVRPGQVVRVNLTGLIKRRYWQLEAREHNDDLAATIHTVRDLLDDIVTRQVVSDVPLCSLLSGGLDSSAITALAHRALLKTTGAGIRSFSVDFVGNSDIEFVPDQIGRQSHDTPFVRDFVKHVGNQHDEILIDSERLLDPDLIKAVVRARDFPHAMSSDLFPSLYMLFESVRRSSTVALSGEAADEVFGGYKWMFEQACIDAETFPWLTLARGYVSTTNDFLKRDLAKELDLAAFEKDSYSDALREVPRLAGEAGLESRLREMSYLNLTRFVQFLLDRKDRLSMAHGLEVRVPFCDHRLVEYVFNVPWAIKTYDGHEKSILRAACADVLPRSIVDRRKSPYPSTQDANYERILKTNVQNVVHDESNPALSIFDAKKIEKHLARPLHNVSDSIERAGLEEVNAVSVWLKDKPVLIAA